MLLCGRYEGFDERIRTVCGFEPLSVGDYVLAGGELSVALTISVDKVSAAAEQKIVAAGGSVK